MATKYGRREVGFCGGWNVRIKVKNYERTETLWNFIFWSRCPFFVWNDLKQSNYCAVYHGVQNHVASNKNRWRFPYGTQNRRSEPSRFLFSFLRPTSLRILGIVFYFQALMFDTWWCYMKQKMGSLKQEMLLETSIPTLVLSRSSRWHMDKIVCWSERQLRLFTVSARGHWA